MPKLVRRSPLARYWGNLDRAVISRGNVTVTEWPFRSVLRVQCASVVGSFKAAVHRVAGVEIPGSFGQVNGVDPFCLCVRPNEWYLSVDGDVSPTLTSDLNSAFSECEATILVTDISDAVVLLTVSGENARDLLAVGCSVDMHKEAFPHGRCAHVVLAKARCLAHALSQEDGGLYHLYVERASAAYLWDWFGNATKEFGSENSVKSR